MTKYQKRCLDLAVKAYQDLNATDKEVAELLSVSDATLARWSETHPDFALAVAEAKQAADARVRGKLYERATGYSYPAQKIMQHQGTPLIVDYVEHVPPDIEAMKFWLKNRKPEEWRDVSSQEVSGPRGGPIPVININIDSSNISKLPDVVINEKSNVKESIEDF